MCVPNCFANFYVRKRNGAFAEKLKIKGKNGKFFLKESRLEKVKVCLCDKCACGLKPTYKVISRIYKYIYIYIHAWKARHNSLLSKISSEPSQEFKSNLTIFNSSSNLEDTLVKLIFVKNNKLLLSGFRCRGPVRKPEMFEV